MNTKKRLTKAERIFFATYEECRNIIMRHGYVRNQRLDGLVKKDTDTMCQSTYDEIQRIISKENKANFDKYERGMISHEQLMLEIDIYNMVDDTHMHEYLDYMDSLLK